MKYVYIAGPYMGAVHRHDWTRYSEIDRHIAQARDAFVQLAQAGIGAFCPHLHSAHFEVIAPEVQPAYWYELDLHFLDACGAILMLPGWQDSKGSLEELRVATYKGLAVLYTVEECIEWSSEILFSQPEASSPESFSPSESARPHPTIPFLRS